MKVVSEGTDITGKISPISCMMCGKVTEKIFACHNCLCGRYCSTVCLNKHSNHSLYCATICELEVLENAKRQKHEIFVSDAEKLPLNLKGKLVRLVGERPLVNVYLENQKIQALWDTGAMVSVLNEEYLQKHFPNAKVSSIDDFTGSGSLKLTAANQSIVSVKGVVILNFGVEQNENIFEIPFLITSEDISNPIIGYNTIEHLIANFKDKMNLPLSLTKVVGSLTIDTAINMVELVEKGREINELYTEARLDKNFVISPGCIEKVQCRIKDMKMNNPINKVVIFSPNEQFVNENELITFESTEILKNGKKCIKIMVYNPTTHNIFVKKGTLMGQVSDVAAAFTLPVFPEKEITLNEIGVECDDEILIKHDLAHLTVPQKEVVSELLAGEIEVFSKSKNDIGHIKDFDLELNLFDEIPVAEPYRKIPRNLYDEVKNHINNLLANGWIKQSFSQYSSPMVCVRKKNGELRLCVDFRRLNKKTIPDRQPIPRIQDILDNLKGNSWFTTLDMSQAYHQGNVAKNSQKYTAFTTPWALYEWLRIPYGIMNAPAGFQRFINNCLANLRDKICSPYLDDVLIFSKTFEQHLVDVKKVLECLRIKGVKLNAKKCSMFRRELRYLGRLISDKGYRPDPADVKALEKCREAPKNVGNLRSLIGFLSYYRTYIKDFSKRLKPLYELLQKGEDGKTDKKQLDSRVKVKWTEKHQKVVNDIIDFLASPEVIAYPDYSSPFIVHCDASQEGLGAVLYQKQGEEMRVISYASKTLSPAERNYHLHSGKLEFLALKWAVTDKFRDYLLYGPKFEIVTDNNPLTYILTTAKLNATGLRWVADLANYTFSIRYKSGKKHVDVDFFIKACSR